ncbi:MAG: translation initiation factor IF-2 [Candidatus Lokiarchaeota archaeon]|nr:translation initiation factor IF-2 [Candidatus Lokiarchaeota archaeon]
MSKTNSQSNLRQPIVTVLGHIDSGKTSILDKIRGTIVQKREAGGITQHIGASFFPKEIIEEICGKLLPPNSLKIPGLLVIDTPGHEAFMNLRKRGGGVADIAILVVDINRGFEVQTRESIRILKERKTPFLVAANKIDRVPGWIPNKDPSIIKSISLQAQHVQDEMEKLIYEIVGDLSFESFESERYDRIKDFTKNVAIIPVSAVTGEGISEIVLVLAGLSQQYLQPRLKASKGPAKGTVLEVKEEIGLGTTIDVIIYEGILKKDDQLVIGGLGDPIQTRIKALLYPKPLDEIRDPREKFTKVNKVIAASGIKISAPNLEGVIAGAPIRAIKDEANIDQVKKEILSELGRFRIETDKDGIILKVDTLGSLEAIVEYLRKEQIPIRIADVGPVSKRDVFEAYTVKEKNPIYAAILSFNNKILPDAKEEAINQEIHILENKIIYRLVEDYQKWRDELKEKIRSIELKDVKRPCKVEILPGCIFRRSNPAIVGVKIVVGVLKTNVNLISLDGRVIGRVMQIQDKGKNIQEAKKNDEVAISIRGATVGRGIDEGDSLIISLSEYDYKILKNKFKEELTDEELNLMEEIANIKRKEKSYWGM